MEGRCGSSPDNLSSDEFDFSDDEPVCVTRARSSYEKQSTKDVYLKACQRCGTATDQRFYKHTNSARVSLKNCSIGDEEVKPIAISLVGDIAIQSLDLEDNGIGFTGASYITEMLSENVIITELNLAENNIGSHGARVFRDVMLNNNTVTILNLSGNGFNENDALYFSEILEKNISLKELYLSHNAFSEVGGQLLYHGIAENTTLEVLDLSWNHLRKAGAVAICRALQLNRGLSKINLAWNGFGQEGALHMGHVLEENGGLRELNLGANRITYEAFSLLLRGLVKNSSLECLKVGNNPILTSGALALLDVIEKADNCKLRDIDLSDISVDDVFMSALQQVKEKHPELKIRFGKVMCQRSTKETIKIEVENPEDPLAMLFEHMRFNGLRLIDFFNIVDKDKSSDISRVELMDEFDEFTRPASLSVHAVDQMMVQLDKDKSGTITFDELLVGQKEYHKKLTRRRINEKKIAAEGAEKEEDKLHNLRVKVKSIMDKRGVDFNIDDPRVVMRALIKPRTPRARTPRH